VVAPRLRVGLVGTGGIMQAAHIPAWRLLSDEVEVVGLAEPVPERRARALALLGDPEGRRVVACPDAAALLDRVALDVVDVAVPAGPAKSEVVRRALAAGCHVTCQKPFVRELAEAESLVAAARAAGRLLSVNQQARFASAFAAAGRWVREGRLGELRTIRLWSDFPNAGPDQWLEYAVHSFDLVRFWAGREPRRVRAWWKRQTPDDRYLLAVWLDFEGVLAAEIWDEMGSSTTLRWAFRLMGSEGTARGQEAFGDAMLPAEVAYTPRGAAYEEVASPGPSYIPHAFAAYFRAFVRAVRGEGPCPTSGEDNLRTLALAFAARRAADLGGWVEL
jgi:predicted dehydrogenase